MQRLSVLVLLPATDESLFMSMSLQLEQHGTSILPVMLPPISSKARLCSRMSHQNVNLFTGTCRVRNTSSWNC